MRIRAKEQLPTPKSQAEYLTQIQRKIDEAWNIILEASVMAETLNNSCDDKTQYEAYNTTLTFQENLESVSSIIEDDLNIAPVDFTHYVEEDEEPTYAVGSPAGGKVSLEVPADAVIFDAYSEKEKLGLKESDCEPTS